MYSRRLINCLGGLNSGVNTTTNSIGNITTTGGNVGIGINSPLSLLHVNGTLTTSNITTANIATNNATISNLIFNGNFSAASSNATIGNIISNNLQTNTFTAANSLITSLTATNSLVTSLTATNSLVTSLTATNINVSNDVQISDNLIALGNSNTVGSIYTTGGNVGIGATTPGERLQVAGNIRLGNSDENYIAFRGTTDDGPGNFNHTFIGERIYGGSEQSELLLFKGNDMAPSSGPDRIRLFAAEHRFDTYTTIVNGTFSEVGQTVSSNRMIITSTGNVGIGTTSPNVEFTVRAPGTVVPSATSSGLVEFRGSSSNTEGESILRLGRGSNSIESFYGASAEFNIRKYNFVPFAAASVMDIRLGNFVENPDTTVMSLMANGFVGIGKTSPNYSLDVSGDINYTGTLYKNASPVVSSQWTGSIGSILSYTSGGVLMTNLTSTNALVTSLTAIKGLTINENIPFTPYHIYCGRPIQGETAICFGITDLSAGSGVIQSVNKDIGQTNTVINPYGANVGIGSTYANYKLDVVGDFRVSSGSGVMLFNSSGNLDLRKNSTVTFNLQDTNSLAQTKIYSNSDTKTYFQSYGDIIFAGIDLSDVRGLCIATSGNVGIGTTSPNVEFTVRQPGINVASPSSSGLVEFRGSQTSTVGESVLRLGRGHHSGFFWGSSAEFNIRRAFDSGTSAVSAMDIRLGLGNSDNPDTNVMTILSTGAVGIGTTSPSSKLNVSGGNIVISNSTARLILQNNATGSDIGSDGFQVVQDGVAAFLINYEPNQNLYIANNNSISITVTSTGNVGIGTTAPTYQFQLSSDSAGKPTTNTWTISSDARLKTDIQSADLDTCYNIVKSLPLKHYRWNDEFIEITNTKDIHKIGWIADDVEKFFPKSVGTVASYGLTDCKTLNTDSIYSAMYGAIQKLINDLEIEKQEHQKTKKQLDDIEIFLKSKFSDF